MTNPLKVQAVCKGCGKTGEVSIVSKPGPRRRLTGEKPAWCVCKAQGGPYNAPPGYVARFTFESGGR